MTRSEKAPAAIDQVLVPPHREAPGPPPLPLSVSAVEVHTASVAGTGSVDVYQGLGAWVDLYDYAFEQRADPAATVGELERRGVQTLYLQTSRWNLPTDIFDPADVSRFIEQAHARGIKVVGWYLPGFANLDRDIRGSLAVLRFVTPSGQRFDGFATDIEDARAVGNRLGLFNHGIAEYSRRLRAAVPPGSAIAAIVPDAKNNMRAPGNWAGFPWRAMADFYDVIMPMAYWSVTKTKCSRVMDVQQYMREVVARTEWLMGKAKPMHPIGGIADCLTHQEVAAYVNIGKQQGWLGASLYDLLTTNRNPSREALWAELGRFRR